MKVLSPLSLKLIRVILKIPRGQVATYGQVAQLAGRDGAARSVVWILHSCSKTHRLPWHRVVNSQGRISFPRNSDSFKQQRNRLLKEGVAVTAQGAINLPEFQWKKKARSKAGGPRLFG